MPIFPTGRVCTFAPAAIELPGYPALPRPGKRVWLRYSPPDLLSTPFSDLEDGNMTVDRIFKIGITLVAALTAILALFLSGRPYFPLFLIFLAALAELGLRRYQGHETRGNGPGALFGYGPGSGRKISIPGEQGDRSSLPAIYECRDKRRRRRKIVRILEQLPCGKRRFAPPDQVRGRLRRCHSSPLVVRRTLVRLSARP